MLVISGLFALRLAQVTRKGTGFTRYIMDKEGRYDLTQKFVTAQLKDRTDITISSAKNIPQNLVSCPQSGNALTTDCVQNLTDPAVTSKDSATKVVTALQATGSETIVYSYYQALKDPQLYVQTTNMFASGDLWQSILVVSICLLYFAVTAYPALIVRENDGVPHCLETQNE